MIMRTENVSQPLEGWQPSVSIDTTDEVAAFKFLDFVFEGIRGGFIEFRYFGAGLKPKVVDQSSYLKLPLDRERVTTEVLSRNGRQMVTVGPAPRVEAPQRGKAGKDQDVISTTCIWADLDFKQAEGGAIEVVQRLRRFPLRPSIVVNSGYGRHVYFVFNRVLRAGDLPEWDEMIKGLRDALRGDSVINLSRVMRLPGTLNIKQEFAVPCEICEEDSSWLRYSVEEVKAAIEEGLRYWSKGPTGTRKEQLSQANMLLDLHRRGVPEEVRRAVLTGERTIRTGINAGRSDDESARDFWIATTLLERGFDIEEIKAVFRTNPHGCGSKWAQRQHGEKYLELTLVKASARVREKHAGLRGEIGNGYEGEEGMGIFNDLPLYYSCSPDGSIWFNPPIPKIVEEGGDRRTHAKLPKPVLVCNSFMWIAEIQQNIDTNQISVRIAFSYHRKPHTTTILRSQMADARQLVAALAGEGAPVNSLNARLVLAYLTAYEHDFGDRIPRKKVTSRFGRGKAEGSFFLPGLASDVEFAPAGPGDSALFRAYSSRRGSLQEWANIINLLASESSIIPQVAILAAFVPPLQSKLQIPNFILDINGNTGSGKSTSLKLAASVYGKPNDPDSLVSQWMNTRVAIEQMAGMCSELPIFLDDAQHCSEDLKRSMVYMIANGRGKGRGAKGGGIRETLTWHTVAISTSEEPLHESSPHEGARGRILPVGGATSPFRPGSASFVQSLERAIVSNHGHAGEKFIKHLNGWTESEWYQWQRRYTLIRTELLRNSSSDIVGRVSGYIGAIQVAAEIACPLLGLKFKPDVISAWLMVHLDEQQSDQNLILLAVRALADHYISNLNNFAGDGRYEASEKRGALHGASKQYAYVGFLRSTIETVFRQRKWNVTAALNKMAEAGILHATEGDRHTKKVSVEGVKHRMICIKWAAILPEDVNTLDELRESHGKVQAQEN
ncbi:MAG: putative primase/helicase [Acidobacteriota bacterium]|jgi:hypothetical protein|nr:putative primase/helicase [Acidobacteriota bacterium]